MTAERSWVLGIDIGGSSLKGALVDPATGEIGAGPEAVPTPQPATPDSVALAARELAELLGAGDGPVGVAFPGVVRSGRTLTAANVDRAWIGAPAEELFSAALGRNVRLLNDADAAGLAEATFGAGRGLPGTVLVLTFGTGIGSALLTDGRLVPRFELGHLEIDGEIAEARASAYAKVRDGLDWGAWTARVQRYLSHLDRLFGPDVVIVGGGISADAEHWIPLLDLPFPVVPATMLNNAGAIGAALFAALSETSATHRPLVDAVEG